MSKAYHLTVAQPFENGERTLFAKTDGDIDVIAYVNTKLFGKNSDHNFDNAELSVKFVELDAIGGDQTRNIMTITADADSVRTLLRNRVAKERKSERGTEDESGDTGQENEQDTDSSLTPAFAS